MKSRIENGKLVIELPLEKPRPSASKKTLLVASTRGVRRTAARFKGQTISVVANAFIYPAGKATSPSGKPPRNRQAEQAYADDEGQDLEDMTPVAARKIKKSGGAVNAPD